jgi:hypothetical protein
VIGKQIAYTYYIAFYARYCQGNDCGKTTSKIFTTSEIILIIRVREKGRNFIKKSRNFMDKNNKKQTRLNNDCDWPVEMYQKAIESLGQSYTPVLKEINKVNDAIKAQTKPLKSFFDKINDVNLQLGLINRYFQQQLNLWEKWGEANKKTFEVFKNLSVSGKRNKFLLENGWILCPYFSGRSIEKLIKSDVILQKNNKEINAIYESFFCENDYSELERMIEGWQKNKYFKDRMDIFTDCLFLLKNFRKNRKNFNMRNPSKIIIPNLIAQIDGITTEFAKDKGLTIDGFQLRYYDGTTDQSLGNHKKFYSLWQEPCFDSSEIYAIKMLEEYLFSKAYPYGQINPGNYNEQPKKVKLRPFFQFSRHKIMHGEDLRYGCIDNTLRLFILLDFLAHLR